jgi:hypothetical protein
MLWFPFRKRLLQITQNLGVELERAPSERLGLEALHIHGSQLRVWLPEALRQSMGIVANDLDVTISQYLREYFVVYLYGSHALAGMLNNGTGIYYTPPPQPESAVDDFDPPMFSRVHSVEFIPGLGKNIVPLKLYLHEKIKADLQVLADKAGIALSQFVREILVSHFLGHTVWPERKPLFTAKQADLANQWANGDLETSYIRWPSQRQG